MFISFCNYISMIGFYLTYRDIFGTTPVDTIETLLLKIPSRFFISVISFINSNLYFDNSIENQKFILLKFFERQPVDTQNALIKNWNDCKKRIKYIFPLFNNLTLINNILLDYRVDSSKDDLTPEEELDILKVILLNNQNLDKTFPDENNFIRKFWRQALPQFEFNYNKNFVTSIQLSENIFEYLKTEYPKQYKEYLKYSNVHSAKEFIKNIIQFYLNGYNKQGRLFYSSFSVDLVKKNPLLENFIIEIINFDSKEFKKKKKDKYFKGLRENPIIKDEKNNYNIFNWNFIVDKFYQGLVFDFHKNTSLQSSMRFDDFKSILGIQFSEKVFFKNLLRRIYPENTDDVVLLCSDEKPDYDFDFYIRINNKILLIEFKDYLMPDLVKYGKSDKVIDYFHSRFVSNENKKKGISQLLYQIKKIDTNIKVYEDLNINKERLMIFPIIIYTDNSFMVPGINRYLDKIFRKKLQASKNDFFLVHILTMISSEFFIEQFEFLKENKTILPSLIHSYYNLKCYYEHAAKTEVNVNTTLKAESAFEQLLSTRFAISKKNSSPLVKEIYEKYK
jgi:hypothetical protein